MGEHVPGFVGYGGIHYLETDLLLRRRLAGEIEKVRDRLADFIAAGKFAGETREKLALSLRTAAFLKEELTPKPDEEGPEKPFSLLDEERLLDYDLALLEKAAGLNTPLDLMEAARGAGDLLRAIDLFDEGLAEVDDLFRQRRQILAG